MYGIRDRRAPLRRPIDCDPAFVCRRIRNSDCLRGTAFTLLKWKILSTATMQNEYEQGLTQTSPRSILHADYASVRSLMDFATSLARDAREINFIRATSRPPSHLLFSLFFKQLADVAFESRPISSTRCDRRELFSYRFANKRRNILDCPIGVSPCSNILVRLAILGAL